MQKYVENRKLDYLQHLADLYPDDAGRQLDYLSQALSIDPWQVVARIQQPNFHHCVINREIAILYIIALQRLNEASSFNAKALLDRLKQSAHPTDISAGFTPDVWEDCKLVLNQSGWTKQEQLHAVMSFATTGAMPGEQSSSSSSSSPSSTTATETPRVIKPAATLAAGVANAVPRPVFAATPGFFQSATSSAASNSNPANPLYVRVVDAPMSISRGLISVMTRLIVVVVGAAAFMALVDDKGLGRGLGINSGKHIQEAEQDGRKIKFDDVKGVEEAKAELQEIVMYLKDPSKFTRLGGRLPRGLLLTGPPGTGKTLLAKAIAGEADVPFFFSSGSQFEEVYVGLGAKRIRELFEAAKKKAPAIIFIDEIDAVGGTRRLKDQSALKMTLNELLVQLDGFEENNGVIVIGATNFMESLDTALLRPGRFDKHVAVPLPDVGGRKEILEMYAKKTKLADDVDLSVLARGTTGFSGADLYNLMNQAALKASIDGLNSINMSVLEYAKDKILMGAERKTAVITKETARCTAFHEAGHALVAVMTEGAMPIHKATIMPRGSALGMVTMLPEGDQTSQSRKEMLAFMDVAMGGRVAEELVFGKEQTTSGAMSDIQHATRIARNMVTRYGFSDEVGIVYHGGSYEEDALVSDETKARIDQEIRRLTDESYKRAKDILTRYSKEHTLLAETLLEYETLSGDEVRDLVKNRMKPKRSVINKNGGARGDLEILAGKAPAAEGGGGGTGVKGQLLGKDATSATKTPTSESATGGSRNQ